MRNRLVRWMALHLRVPGIVPVIVYQMGKVGSSAVFATLQHAGVPAFHVHRMNRDHVQQVRQRRRALGWADMPVAPHDLLGFKLNDSVIAKGRRAAIVTIVRDPIARNLSSYFEYLQVIVPAALGQNGADMDDLVEGFHARFPHDEPLTWFDDEMRPVLGIDVFASPFPIDDGYQIIRTDKCDVLILKCESTDEAKGGALARFIGTPMPACVPVNVTAQKHFGTLFERFRERVRMTPEYVERMLGSRYATHFYSAAELSGFKQRYLRRGGS